MQNVSASGIQREEIVEELEVRDPQESGGTQDGPHRINRGLPDTGFHSLWIDVWAVSFPDFQHHIQSLILADSLIMI